MRRRGLLVAAAVAVLGGWTAAIVPGTQAADTDSVAPPAFGVLDGADPYEQGCDADGQIVNSMTLPNGTMMLRYSVHCGGALWAEVNGAGGNTVDFVMVRQDPPKRIVSSAVPTGGPVFSSKLLDVRNTCVTVAASVPAVHYSGSLQFCTAALPAGTITNTVTVAGPPPPPQVTPPVVKTRVVYRTCKYTKFIKGADRKWYRVCRLSKGLKQRP